MLSRRASWSTRPTPPTWPRSNARPGRLRGRAASAEPFDLPDYDEAVARRDAEGAARAGRGLRGFERRVRSREAVDPVRHLSGPRPAGAACPTGGSYVGVEPGLPVGEYRLACATSRSTRSGRSRVYNARRILRAERPRRYSINNVTAPRTRRLGTVNFGGCGDERPNCLPLMDGWNYTVRLYRPRPRSSTAHGRSPPWNPPLTTAAHCEASRPQIGGPRTVSPHTR